MLSFSYNAMSRPLWAHHPQVSSFHPITYPTCASFCFEAGNGHLVLGPLGPLYLQPHGCLNLGLYFVAVVALNYWSSAIRPYVPSEKTLCLVMPMSLPPGILESGMSGCSINICSNEWWNWLTGGQMNGQAATTENSSGTFLTVLDERSLSVGCRGVRKVAESPWWPYAHPNKLEGRS